jgi:hypothetical protein
MGNSFASTRVRSDEFSVDHCSVPVHSKQYAYELAEMHAHAYVRDCSFNRFNVPEDPCYSKLGNITRLFNTFYNGSTRENLFRSKLNMRNQFISQFLIQDYSSSMSHFSRKYKQLTDATELHTRNGFLTHIQGVPSFSQFKTNGTHEIKQYIHTLRGLASYVAQDINGQIMIEVLQALVFKYITQFSKDPFFKYNTGARMITTGGYD